jgi:hypothetical protein
MTILLLGEWGKNSRIDELVMHAVPKRGKRNLGARPEINEERKGRTSMTDT